MRQLAPNAIATLRKLELSIAQYQLLVICRRDANMQWGLHQSHCTHQQIAVLRQMELRCLIEFRHDTWRWELRESGRLLLDLANLLAPGIATLPETAGKVIEMPLFDTAQKRIPLDTEQNRDDIEGA